MLNLTYEEDSVEIETVELAYDVTSVVRKIDGLDYSEAENIKKFFLGM